MLLFQGVRRAPWCCRITLTFNEESASCYGRVSVFSPLAITAVPESYSRFREISRTLRKHQNKFAEQVTHTDRHEAHYIILSELSELPAVGIRCADHATPSVR
jgi:hypothetical protein